MSASTQDAAAVETAWAIDSAHSNVEFSVKHMMISTVKGQFSELEGTIEWDGQDFSTARVDAAIDTSTVTTFNEMRDNHLRTNDFFNSEQWPEIRFTSSQVKPEGSDEFKMLGDLTIRDVTKPVELDVDFEGLVDKDAFGKARAAFTATTEINRKDFGVNWNQGLEAGGVIVGDKVKVTLNIAIVR